MTLPSKSFTSLSFSGLNPVWDSQLFAFQLAEDVDPVLKLEVFEPIDGYLVAKIEVTRS